MSSEYIFYNSRADFEACKAVGIFTRETLIERAKTVGLPETSLVLDASTSLELTPIAEIDFLQPAYLDSVDVVTVGESSIEAAPDDPVAKAAANANYFIPTAEEEEKIRSRYRKSPGHYREATNPIWRTIREATGTSMYSQQEMGNFVNGASIRDIFEYRCGLTGNIRTPSNGLVGRKGTEVAKPKTDSDSDDSFISEHPFLFVFGITAVLIVILVTVFPDQGGSSRNRTLERAEYKARNGMATEMTEREAEEFRKKQEADSAQHRAYVNTITEARQSRYSDRELEIYRYMRRRYEGLGDNYDSMVHDDMIAREAASRFGVSASQATDIYIRVDSN